MLSLEGGLRHAFAPLEPSAASRPPEFVIVVAVDQRDSILLPATIIVRKIGLASNAHRRPRVSVGRAEVDLSVFAGIRLAESSEYLVYAGTNTAI